jgi:carboxypeptidase PM20D1
VDPQLVSAIGRALNEAYPGTPVFPSMSSGASDSMWFRHQGVASYNISPVFTKASENFSHGLNERTPVADIGPSITYCLSLFRSLSQ